MLKLEAFSAQTLKMVCTEGTVKVYMEGGDILCPSVEMNMHIQIFFSFDGEGILIYTVV